MRGLTTTRSCGFGGWQHPRADRSVAIFVQFAVGVRRRSVGWNFVRKRTNRCLLLFIEGVGIYDQKTTVLVDVIEIVWAGKIPRV